VSDAASLAFALALSTAGLAWLAAAMEVHWEQIKGARPYRLGRAFRLRVQGVAALLMSLWLCLGADHASMAALVWIMSLAAAALSVALTLAWRPHWLSWLVR
jgi:hypothetical protein